MASVILGVIHLADPESYLGSIAIGVLLFKLSGARTSIKPPGNITFLLSARSKKELARHTLS